MLLRRLPKGSPRRYSVAAAKSASAIRFDTRPHVPPVSPLRAYPVLQRVEDRIGRPMTLLPTPLPELEQQDELYFPSSQKQQSLAVIAACLRDLYDVKRAEIVFDRLREDASIGSSVITVDTYNAFMLAYAQLQAPDIGDAREQTSWAHKLWDVWNTLESGEENIRLNSTTLAIAFLAVVRAPIDIVGRPSPVDFLRIMLDKKLSIPEILNSPILATATDRADVRSLLSIAAQELGRTDVQEMLNNLEQPMLNLTPKPRIEVPDARSVRVLSKDGSILNDGTFSAESPYNLTSLQENLQILQNDLGASPHTRQLRLEETAVESTIEKLRHEMEKLDDLELGAASRLANPTIQLWMCQWMKATEASLVTDIAELAEKEKGRFTKGKRQWNLSLIVESYLCSLDNPVDSPITPFLRLLPPSKLAVITILELMRLHGTGGVAEGMKTGRALVSVGKCVEVECMTVWGKKEKRRKAQAAAAEEEGTEDASKDKQGVTEESSEELDGSMPEWTQIVRVRLGSFLVDRLMANAVVRKKAIDPNGEEIYEEQPAFTHTYEYIRGKKLGVIRLNSVVNERMARDSLRETLQPRHLPMLVKPRPWERYDQGGYLTLKSMMMRIKDSFEQRSYIKQASAAGHLDLVYECLDALGETPWRINERILKVVLEVWNSGEAMAGIPPAQLHVEEPVRPDDFDENPRSRANYLFNMKAILTDKRNNHGERCSTNYKLEVARAYVNDEFYLPHNLDFRGRAYPIPPHLNHIGDDLSRGLLLFAEPRLLGERGLRWLKIHLANVFGYDKASFDERVQFVEDHMDDIRDSVQSPLDGKGWWQKADDPWQCLSTSMELVAAVESGDPHMYESRLPVHQDGTCNGLQHYAALGGDEAGAQHVNLEKGDRPADVYSHVARMVDKVVDVDAAKGDTNAKIVQGKITRKVVKQTVMTTVYGVTFIGARDQIEKQLRDIVGVDREQAWEVATYLARRVLACIGDLFHGASQIQHWLSQSARLIAKSIPDERIALIKSDKARDVAQERMTSVIWTTALGLPIVQPYRKAKKKQVMTALQSVFISDPNLPTQVDPIKQSAAFPPNFVHSLDATHMMLTALECRSAAITYASVHDSYWTHASTVDEMSAIIRDTFIALHDSNILEKLRAEFLERYAGYRVPLSALTENELCQIIKTLARPEVLVGTKESSSTESTPSQTVTVSPSFLSTMLALVTRIAPKYSGEASVKAAVAAAREKLSHTELHVGQAWVDDAVQNEPEAPAPVEEASPEVAEADEDAEAPVKKRRDKSAKGLVAAGALPQELRYVLLTDILPFLPDKGDFDVRRIKDSQYFFS